MWRCAILLLIAGMGIAQTHKPFQSQSAAGVTYGVNKDGQQTVVITNVGYEATSTAVPGRPQDERLLVRTTTRTKQVVDEIGMEASTTVEAWPLGIDPKQKPLYALKVDGIDSKIVDGALLVILRGLEDTEWWSVYKLGTGERLFDTYVPLLGFSIRRDVQTMRYAGFDAPEDDGADTRLREPHVVGVLIYASAERVVREALITSDDPKQAQTLRSVRGHEPVHHPGRRTLPRVETFHQPELSFGGIDGVPYSSDRPRRFGFGSRANATAFAHCSVEALD